MIEIYPSFLWVERRGVLFLNARLPKDYKSKIKEFYNTDGREKLEELALNISKSMEGLFGQEEIRLRWDDEKGLIGISIGPSGGIYLNNLNQFQEHNLGTKTSLMTSPIIINYISELLKS
ncbi:hypothetical protein GOV13_04690 [Candidatus Pacearchaeota archaeon]|nr:hypothetical protein [Candidatus Pacearchaeota archaeon]